MFTAIAYMQVVSEFFGGKPDFTPGRWNQVRMCESVLSQKFGP